MRKHLKTSGSRIFSAVMAVAMMVSPMEYVHAAETNTVYINEVESNDASGGNDWVEIINTGTEEVDISGWFFTDDQGLERLTGGKTTPFAEGTMLQAGAVLVLEQEVEFDFGLGKEDTAYLYNKNSEVMDSFTWTSHAQGTYSRVLDGTEFVDQDPTKGAANVVEQAPASEGKLVINEINSSPDDWVEVMNVGETALDISGYEIRDNSDDHRWHFPDGTTVEAGELLLVSATSSGKVYNDEQDIYVEGTFGSAIGIGSGDSIRLYDKVGAVIDSHSWTEHASYDGDAAKASLGRYPDGTGSFVLMKETPNAKNDWYKPEVALNEVAQDVSDIDWVEIYNMGTTAVDLSGWYIMDNDPVSHASGVTPVAEGTMLQPGECYVFEQNQHFTFGLGKNDEATVYNKDGVAIDSYAWTSHATNNGVYARIPDGTGAFVDFQTLTKGKVNVIVNPVVINEIQSKDPDGKADWIEFANPTGEELDISGIVLKDNDDSHAYTIPSGTTIPANGFLLLTEDDFGFGLGGEDAVRLFENDFEITSVSWAEHGKPTRGLYPDVNGNEYRVTLEATPGTVNKFAGIPDVVEWNGSNETNVFDTEAMFLEDSSGLDFFKGQLYAVDNGTGKFWILDVAADGKLSFANGFSDGKRVRFQKDAENEKAAGPDAEGITVDGDGYVYLACERDNSAKGVNYNTILKVDPKAEGTDLIAMQQWNLTESLPQVSANMGIEAVEWVANAEVEGKLFDQNTNAAFDSSKYTNAVANGVFFVALEDNGHAYAYVLNTDGSVVQIADIDSKLGGAMALDYDTYNDVLWVVADNGYNNMAANISFTGESEPNVVHVKPPSSVDVTLNYEGFAIAEAEYAVNGTRAVYRFQDGVTTGSLLIGSVAHSDASDDTTPPIDGDDTTPPADEDEENTNPPTDEEEKAPENNVEDCGNNDNNSETDTRVEAPQTGDDTNVIFYVIVIMLATAFITYRIKKNSIASCGKY